MTEAHSQTPMLGKNPWIQHAWHLANLKRQSTPGKWVLALREYAKQHGMEARAMERYQTSYYDYEALLVALHAANGTHGLPSFDALVQQDGQGLLPVLARSQLGDIEMLIGHIAPEQLEQFLRTWLSGEMRGPAQASLRQLCQQIRRQRRNTPASDVPQPPRGRNAYMRVQNMPPMHWKSLFIAQVLSDPMLFGKNQLPSRVVRDLPLAGPYHGIVADLVLIYIHASGSQLLANEPAQHPTGSRKTDLTLVLFNRPYASNRTAYETRYGADDAWAVVLKQDDEDTCPDFSTDRLLRHPGMAFGYIECQDPKSQPGTITYDRIRQADPWSDPDKDDRNWLWQQLLSESIGQ